MEQNIEDLSWSATFSRFSSIVGHTSDPTAPAKVVAAWLHAQAELVALRAVELEVEMRKADVEIEKLRSGAE